MSIDIKKKNQYLREHANEKTIVDHFCGLCTGVATYEIAKALFSPVHRNAGIFTVTGCAILEAVMGISVGSFVRDEVQRLRLTANYILTNQENKED